MKKFAIATLLCLTTLAITGCGGPVDPGDNPPITEVKVVGLELDETAKVDCGFTKTLTYNVLPENATNKNVTWTSENPSIATVDQNGVVTGVSNGTTKITCTTEDGGLKRECVVTVEGYRLSSKVFTNIGKLQLNTYNEEEGYKNYTIDDSHEDYFEFSFNRKDVREWSSTMLWYNQKDTYSAVDIEVELVSGHLPAIMVELAGEDTFKQFKRISLTQGETSTLHFNISDYNIKTGEYGEGSYGFLFLELNNPNDKSDTYRDTDDEVVLRFKKISMTEGTKEAPEKINNLRFESRIKKLVFEKDIASQDYDLEVYKIEEGSETKLELDTAMPRFITYGEKIPNMEVAFTPKSSGTVDQDFSKVPGNYRARVRGVNSAGEGEWSDDAFFTIEGEEPEPSTGYIHKNISNDGEITVNEYNQNNTYNAEYTDDGYKLTFTSSCPEGGADWGSFVAYFDKTKTYESLTLKFEVVKSSVPLTGALIELGGPDNSPSKVQHYYDLTGRTGIIEETFAITADLSQGWGNIVLGFDRTYGAGDVEILVHELSLNMKESGYKSENINNNGEIIVNEYNQNNTYNAEYTDDGYKLTFTSSCPEGGADWGSFVAYFDKTKTYESLTLKFEVVKSSVPLTGALIELGGPDNSPSKVQHYYDLTGRTGIIEETFAITADLSQGWGNIVLGFDRTYGAGDVEILVTELSLH